jgi:flagellar protein FlbD
VIELSRLNGKKFVLNCELIKTIEATPDTVICLTSGEKLMVREPVADVMSKTMDYLKRLRQEPPGAAVAGVEPEKKT